MPISSDVPPVEAAGPVPVRFWWLTRGGSAVGIGLLFLVLIRLAWARAAEGRLDREMALARARGEPVTLEDFADPPPTPDDDANAADLLTRAMGQLAYTPAERAWADAWDSALPLTVADRAMLAAIVADNASPLALARRAADRRAVNWGVHLQRPVSAVRLPGIARQRQLGRLLAEAFALHHADGNDAAAMDDLRALFRQSDAMATDTPFTITHLIACGLQTIGTTRVQQVASTLRVDSGRSRAAAEALLRRVCDESSFVAGGRRQWLGERVYVIELADDPTAGIGRPTSSLARAIIWPVRPVLKMDAARRFPVLSGLSAAMSAPTWPAARAALPPPPPPQRHSGLDVAFASPMGSTDARPVETHYRGLTDRRIAAVLLALRLFQADHAGHLPADLSALVPAYLPAVPIDPMSPAAQPLRYIATTGREAVYSVGTDGVDDGGSTAPTRPVVPPARAYRWGENDVVSPWRPSTQPPK